MGTERSRRWGVLAADVEADAGAARLVRALGRLGEVEVVSPTQLTLRAGWPEPGLSLSAEGCDLARWDAVLLGRVSPDVHPDLQLDAARALSMAGVPCINSADAMLAAQDKLWTSALLARARVPTPPCAGLGRHEQLDALLSEWGEAVGKPLYGSLGVGLIRCTPADGGAGRDALAEALEREPYVLQRWVETGGVDYRLFVVDGRVEACLRRTAAPGDWRTNAELGGHQEPIVAPRAWQEVAVSAAAAVGLAFGGVDLAVDANGPTVLEVNGFPGFEAIYETTGRDMADAVAQLVLRRSAEAPTGRRATQLPR